MEEPLATAGVAGAHSFQACKPLRQCKKKKEKKNESVSERQEVKKNPAKTNAELNMGMVRHTGIAQKHAERKSEKQKPGAGKQNSQALRHVVTILNRPHVLTLEGLH